MVAKRSSAFKISPEKHCALNFTVKCFSLLDRYIHLDALEVYHFLVKTFRNVVSSTVRARQYPASILITHPVFLT